MRSYSGVWVRWIHIHLILYVSWNVYHICAVICTIILILQCKSVPTFLLFIRVIHLLCICECVTKQSWWIFSSSYIQYEPVYNNFVWFVNLRSSQQFFSYVGKGLPGLNQYCVLLKDTTQWRRWGSNPQPMISRQALYHCATALPYISKIIPTQKLDQFISARYFCTYRFLLTPLLAYTNIEVEVCSDQNQGF